MSTTAGGELNPVRLMGAGIQIWSAESMRFLGYGLLMLLASFVVTQLPIIGFPLALMLEGPLVAGVVHATRRIQLHERPEVDDFIAGFAQTLPLGIASLASALVAALGTVLLILPGLIAASVLWILIPVLVAEGGTLQSAFVRSWNLARPQLLPLVLLRLAFFVLEFLIVLPPMEALFKGVQPSIEQVLPALLGAWLLGPFKAILATLVYSRLRGGPERQLDERA